MRDDFSSAIKKALAERAGHRCSYPDCEKVTHGPSDESESSTSNTGMACHISAASGGPGARRYDQKMSNEQRTSVDNGIWMCYLHGKLIDTDEKYYSIEVLKQWRQVAEKKAKFRQAHGDKYAILPEMLRDIGLPDESISINGVGNENFIIGKLLKNARVEELWGGDISHAIRDLSIEFVRNAFNHGGATQFRMTIDENSIHLYDDGGDYSIWDLSNCENGSGGTIAARHAVDCLKDRLLIVADRSGGQNHTLFTLVDDPCDIPDLTECFVDLNRTELKRGQATYQVHDFCRSKCVILPAYFTISDSAILKQTIPIDDGRPVVFVLSETSPRAQEVLEEHFPGCLTIRL